jgi:hypothetical protein
VVCLVATLFDGWSRKVGNLLLNRLFSSCVIVTNRFGAPPTPSGVDEVHLLLATAFGIGDCCIVDVAEFLEEVGDAGMLVGYVKAARPAVVAVAREASLGSWWVLVG